MSEHVQRAERDNASYYILGFGLLFALVMALYEAYKKPRIAYVEAKPQNAQIYIEDELICESSPCKINLQFWPKSIWVRAERHHSQEVAIEKFKHFTSDTQTYKISLKSFPAVPDKPSAIPQAKKNVTKPLDKAPQTQDLPNRKTVPKPPVATLPLVCRESQAERKLIQNREPVLCYYEADKTISSQISGEVSGECYATYWVLRTGFVQNVHSYGCMEERLIEPAKLAFAKRIYLPALRNGRAVNRVTDGEIKYGPNARYAPNTIAAEDKPTSYGERLKATPRNADASVSSCPAVKPPAHLNRSGHCIFEFDLSNSGKVSQLRQIKCTHADLKSVTSSVFDQCKFMPARTDGAAVSRAYMKYQIDVDIYDAQRRKIPVHASFSEKAVNKPYMIYE